ncbi:NACHT domain-containing protein [Marivita sp.]|uniref:NACHT domain-containing protein n=1 Tax=Marivita sp. TaxID=2003365 RepID=UPI003A867D89
MAKRSGSELRDKVAGLLSIKFPQIEVEKRLSTTTADIFYIDDNTIFPQRIAVECKDWEKPLSSSNISSIFNLYYPSFANREIDKLLIVSNHELGMQPSDSINKLPNVAYQQFDTFVHSLMNFNLLLQSNSVAFDNHEASENFIQPRVEGKQTLLIDAVTEWLELEDSPVSMVYGGYGLGKTSFSYYLTSFLSTKYRDGSFGRIPIRIALGGLYTKQDLKALICSELTGAEGQPRVGNFSYDLFLQMLRAGAIFLILDGFDEMRHAMSIQDFAYTFEQMAPLFQGKSKAIILGRPDAFFDDIEESDVLDSLLAASNSSRDNFPKFEVDRFTKEEVNRYLECFCQARALSDEEISLVKNLRESEYEILSRPVQASMFTKILTSLSRRHDGQLTRYKLYLEFIRRFAIREEEKPARSLVRNKGDYQLGYSDPRSVFMQKIAWWLSTVHRENRFLPSEVPVGTLPKELRLGRGDTDSIREALVGSVAEHVSKSKSSGLVGVKGPNFYYFPHKSYIEFLVSQYFCREDFSKEMYRTFFSFANPEMISFVREGPEVGARNISMGLEHVLGHVPREILQIGAESNRIKDEIMRKEYAKLSVAARYMVYERFCLMDDLSDMENFLLTCINSARVQKNVSTAMRLVGDYLLKFDGQTFVPRLVANSFNSMIDVQFRSFLNGGFPERAGDRFYADFVILRKCISYSAKSNWRFCHSP